MTEFGGGARLSCFAIISAVETDLRHYLADAFTSAGVPEFLHPDLRKIALDRRSRDSEALLVARSADMVLLEYLDFGDLSALIFSHISIMPSASAENLRDVAHKLAPLVPIRNRVCHSRPLELDDFATLSDVAIDFTAKANIDWPELRSTLRTIRETPSAILRTTVPAYWASDIGKLQNNLPTPEFEDTGYIGRARDVSSLKKHLLGPYPVISIIGEGGLGKTALALKVLYGLLDDAAALKRFDAICWVSLKTHRLTASGIMEINGAIRDSLGLFQEAARVLGDPSASKRTFTESLAEVLEYMKEFKILLALDNFETIGHSEVVGFLRDLSGESKVLITSRIGMGQIELAYPLVPLDGKDSAQLMRRSAQAVNLKSVLEAKQDKIDRWCKKLHFNPLAIKWFVSAVSLGKDPTRLTDSTSGDYKELLQFSFTNLYEGLTEEARKLVVTFGIISRPVSRTELCLILNLAAPALDQDRIDVALNLLFNSSVIRRASNSSGSSSESGVHYCLTEFATQFIRQLEPLNRDFGQQIQKAVNRLRQSSEAAQRDLRYYKYKGRAIRAKTKDERLVTTMLMQSIRETDAREYSRALATLDKADLLLPQFVEIHRIRAFILAKLNDSMRAKREYEIALECDATSEITRYEFARFLAFDLEDYDAAASMIDSVLVNAPDDIPPKSLKALIETRRGNYLVSTALYEELIALSTVDQLTQHIVSIRDQAAESYRRWSEQHLQYKESALFRRCVLRALNIIFEGFRKGYRDKQLERTLGEVCSEAIYGAIGLNDADTALEIVRLLTSQAEVLPSVIEVGASIERFVNLFHEVPGLEEAVRRLPLRNGGPLSLFGDEPVDNRAEHFGTIVRVEAIGKYGFIESGGERWFFHRSNLISPSDWERVRQGVACRFTVGTNNQGKCATGVILES